MQALKLPPINARIKEEDGKKWIFDIIRKKFVVLTPEEWVRQHFIHFMVAAKYPASLMAVERMVVVNRLRQRADIVLYNRQGQPALIVECKAPDVPVNNDTLAQVARYNIPLKVSYLIVTNGIDNYCIQLDKTGQNHKVIHQIPDFETINESRF